MDHESLTFEFQHLFRQWAAWYRLRRTVEWLIRGLIFGLSLALGFSISAVFQQSLLREEFGNLIIQITLFSVAMAALAGWVWPVSKEQLARFFDQYFRLQERSSTSLEIIESFGKNSEISIANSLLEAQLRDTLITGSQIRLTARFFFRPTRFQGILLANLILGLALLGAFGEPLFERAMQRRQTRQAIAQEAARLEEFAEQIRSSEKIYPNQAEQIAQALEESAKKMNQAETAEQALAVLSNTQNQLKALDDPQAQSQAEALRNTGRRLLEDNPSGSGTPLESFAQNLTEGDYLTAAQNLANLDTSQLSPEEASSLADQLEKTSRMLADSNPDLAEQLAEASQALKNGDRQAAQQALQEAAEVLTNAGQQIAQSQVARQAVEQISQGKTRLIQAGSGQDQAAQTGTGRKTSSGSEDPGQTTGGQPGNSNAGAGSSGAGTGESAGLESEGPEAGADPIGQNNQPGEGGIRTYEEIFAPQRLGGHSEAEVALPGSDQEGDQVIGQGEVLPGEANPSRVPYIDVLPDYTEAYRKAIESGQVPVSLRALVKKYFSSLEP